jgi:hypothetical protein
MDIHDGVDYMPSTRNPSYSRILAMISWDFGPSFVHNTDFSTVMPTLELHKYLGLCYDSGPSIRALVAGPNTALHWSVQIIS